MFLQKPYRVWVNTYRYIFSGLFTSINPSYFDVNYRGIGFWPIPIWVFPHLFGAVYPCPDPGALADLALLRPGHAAHQLHALVAAIAAREPGTAPGFSPEATLKRRKKMGRVQQEKWRFHPFTHQKWRFHHEKLRFHHEKLGFTMKNGGVRTKHMGIADEAMDWGKGKSLKKGCFYQPNIGGSCRCCLQLRSRIKRRIAPCMLCVCVGSTL